MAKKEKVTRVIDGDTFEWAGRGQGQAGPSVGEQSHEREAQEEMSKKFESKGEGATIDVTVLPEGKDSKSFSYDGFTPSGEIVVESLASAGMDLEPVETEAITETIERSRGIFEGFKLGFSLSRGEFYCEKKPRKEVRTYKRVLKKKPE